MPNPERGEIREAVPGRCPTYVVVTPAFNEEKHLPSTIRSMVMQTAKPAIWVIVDDGSSDRTWDLISSAGVQQSWIHPHRRTRKTAPNEDGLITASEAAAFLEGLSVAYGVCPDPGFIVKLDSDLEFDADYFRLLLSEFEADPKLGVSGGTIREIKDEELVVEKTSPAHVRGATKVYRASCYEGIGGIRAVFGWDVIDEILAREGGWNVRSQEHIPLVHLRRTASRGGRFAGWARNGYMAYYIGMGPFRVLLRALFRCVVARDVVQGAGIAYGYFRHFLRMAPRLPDRDLRKIVRRHQWVTARSSLGRHCLSPLSEKGAS